MIFLYCVLAILALPLPAQAQTPINREMGKQYYQNCISRRNYVMTEDTQEMLCTCTAAKMMETMTLEDMQIMVMNTQEGRIALNEMLINVYAPCMEFPIQDLIQDQCVNDPSITAMSKRPVALCDCLALDVADYIATNGPNVLREVLAKDPNITDPLGPMMSSPTFQKQAQESTMACIKKYQ